MYERGVEDAEHDELNSFYYQHYYYYRRGYDSARRRARATDRQLAPVALLALALLALAAGAWWFVGRDSSPAEVQQVATAPAAAPTARPTRVPTPTAAPTVTPTPPPSLAVGGRARVVNLNGSPLRAREGPGLNSGVVARIPEGSEVTLRDGPVEADGYSWWLVEAEVGSGWAAGRSPEGAIFLEPVP